MLFAIGLLAVSACAPSSSASASLTPSTASSPAAAGNLPPGCAPIDLHGPTGERVDLNGPWIETGTTAQPMTWWIRTEGNCVWGAGQVDEVAPPGSVSAVPHQVQSLSGLIGSDLVITGEILFLGPLPAGAPGNPSRYSALRMLVEIDDAGQISLHEDREPSASGPRCPEPAGYCPAPLVLEPVD
jgi:hypothetical protein